MVESHDESADDFKPMGLDLLHLGHQVFSPVLGLAALFEAFLDRRLEAYEDPLEPRQRHEVKELRIISQVKRRFREKQERIPPVLYPQDNLGKEDLDLFPVADEVVIHHEDLAPPAPCVQGLELLYDLPDSLRSGHTAIHCHNVAEFTVEGAATGILDRHEGIIIHVDEIPARNRGEGQVGKLFRPVYGFCSTVFQVDEEGWQHVFRFAENEMIHFLEFVVHGGKKGPPRHYGFSHVPAPGNDIPGRLFLD